jgi:hypothetical protein
MTNANKLGPPESNSTAELPSAETESPIIADMRARIERLKAQVARLQEPFAEQYEILKNAALDSGVPRQTLSRWVRYKLVKHKYDAHGQLWIDVKDAIRQRFALAPAGGPK